MKASSHVPWALTLFWHNQLTCRKRWHAVSSGARLDLDQLRSSVRSETSNFCFHRDYFMPEVKLGDIEVAHANGDRYG